MKLFITRHGETEENKQGVLQGHLPGKLSPEGIAQAKALAVRLRDEQFDCIYASDLARVVATAVEINRYHPHTPFSLTADLRERDFGEFAGVHKHDLPVNNVFDLEPQQGESRVVFYDRAQHIIDDLLIKHPQDRVLLICHGGIAQAIIARLLHKTYAEMSGMEKLGNTSLSVFEVGLDGKCQTIYYNSTTHLEV